MYFKRAHRVKTQQNIELMTFALTRCANNLKMKDGNVNHNKTPYGDNGRVNTPFSTKKKTKNEMSSRFNNHVQLFRPCYSLRSKRFRGAKSEEETGLSAFCPREKWGESKNKKEDPLLLIFALAPFFARAKRRKPRFFFALCSTETLATQASLVRPHQHGIAKS